METHPHDSDGWLRILTVCAAGLSVLELAIFLLYPIWGVESSPIAVALGGAGSVALELVLIIVVVLILDLVVVVLTLVIMAKPRRRAYRFVGVISLLIVAGPIAGNIIWSAATTNG